MTISKEERAELRRHILDFDGDEYDSEEDEITVACILGAAPALLDALDAADERIAGLEAEVKYWREYALAWAHWAASVTGEADQEIPDLTKFVESQKSRIAELEAAAQWRPIEEAPKDGTWPLNDRREPRDVLSDENRSDFGGWSNGYRSFTLPTFRRWLPIPALPEGGV